MLKMVMPINSEFVKEVGTYRWMRRTAVRQFSKRVLRKDNTVVLPTGLRMRLPMASKFASEVFITGSKVDWGSEEVFANHLDASEVVLDVGANIGYYSLYMLPRVRAVHAFEPDPRVLPVLRSNLAAHQNAHVHSLAVGKHIGMSSFILEPNSEVSHLAHSPTQRGEGSLEVSVTTIDDFVARNDLRITGIKVDVEGADLDVIRGAIQTLELQAPLVLTETTADERLFGLIQPLGYNVFAFVKHTKTLRFELRKIYGHSNLQTKMLFLVPTRLNSAFESLAQSKSS
jgi:FkbM family methyltransferase